MFQCHMALCRNKKLFSRFTRAVTMTMFNYSFFIITEVKVICHKRTVLIGDKDVQISLEKRKHMCNAVRRSVRRRREPVEHLNTLIIK